MGTMVRWQPGLVRGSPAVIWGAAAICRNIRCASRVITPTAPRSCCVAVTTSPFMTRSMAATAILPVSRSLTLESIWRADGRSFRLGYELENNNRDDYLSGNNFISYSATRHELALAATQPAGADWRFTLGGDYRLSRYNDADVIAGVSAARREERRWRWSLEAEYHLSRHLDLVAEYHYTNNDSNIVLRSYQRNQYTLGVQGYF